MSHSSWCRLGILSTPFGQLPLWEVSFWVYCEASIWEWKLNLRLHLWFCLCDCSLVLVCSFVCIILGCVDLRKCTVWELHVKFYLGQNEDCSLGDSTSSSSEKLLQRGGEKFSVYVILVKGEYTQSSTYYLQKVFSSLMKVTANHKEQIPPWRILVFF